MLRFSHRLFAPITTPSTPRLRIILHALSDRECQTIFQGLLELRTKISDQTRIASWEHASTCKETYFLKKGEAVTEQHFNPYGEKGLERVHLGDKENILPIPIIKKLLPLIESLKEVQALAAPLNWNTTLNFYPETATTETFSGFDFCIDAPFNKMTIIVPIYGNGMLELKEKNTAAPCYLELNPGSLIIVPGNWKHRVLASTINPKNEFETHVTPGLGCAPAI